MGRPLPWLRSGPCALGASTCLSLATVTQVPARCQPGPEQHPVLGGSLTTGALPRGPCSPAGGRQPRACRVLAQRCREDTADEARASETHQRQSYCAPRGEAPKGTGLGAEGSPREVSGPACVPACEWRLPAESGLCCHALWGRYLATLHLLFFFTKMGIKTLALQGWALSNSPTLDVGHSGCR